MVATTAAVSPATPRHSAASLSLLPTTVPLHSLSNAQLKELLLRSSLQKAVEDIAKWEDANHTQCTGHDLSMCARSAHVEDFGISNGALVRKVWG